MPTVIIEQDLITEKITPIVDKLMQENSIFANLNKNAIIKNFCQIFRENNQDLGQILQPELAEIIERMMNIEVMYRLLEDLTPEQIEMFDQGIARR